MDGWNERFLDSTRGRVVQYLQRGEATVKDLAAHLGLTANAIRAHLATLERDDLVRQSGQRPGRRRPEAIYSLTEGAEQLFPQAYGVLLDVLVDVLREHLPPASLEGVLREVGNRIGRAQPLPPFEEDLHARVQRAVAFLGDIGGLAEVVDEGDGLHIQGHRCPLSAIASRHREACMLAEALLEEILGVPVRQRCSHNGHPACHFAINPVRPA